MLDVINASTDVDYTTTSAMRALILGATATSTAFDSVFSNNIRQASRWVDTYVGYPLSVQTYRETIASFGRRSLMLKRTPIRSVVAVYDATDTGVASLSTDFRVENSDAGLLTRNQGWPWSAPLQPPGSGGPFLSSIPLEAGPLSGQEYKPWLTDYTAGWTYAGIDSASVNYSTALGSTSTGRTLPEDVELAVLIKAQAFYLGGDEVQSEHLGDMSVNYRSLGTDNGRLITRSEQLLQPYRRVA